MASVPITAWKVEGEKVEIVTDFFFLGSKITADGDCSHEIRRQLLLGRKAMTSWDSVLKSVDVTLLTKVRIVKVMVFPVVMYDSESWTIKKVEHQRIDAFELWCWRRLLKVPWTARRSNQWILMEINPEYSLEGLMLKLKFQYFRPWCEQTTHWKSPWCWERVRAEGEEGVREWDGWTASLMQWTWTWANFGRWWGTEAWRAAGHGVAESQTQLGNGTATTAYRMDTQQGPTV